MRCALLVREKDVGASPTLCCRADTAGCPGPVGCHAVCGTCTPGSGAGTQPGLSLPGGGAASLRGAVCHLGDGPDALCWSPAPLSEQWWKRGRIKPLRCPSRFSCKLALTMELTGCDRLGGRVGADGDMEAQPGPEASRPWALPPFLHLQGL